MTTTTQELNRFNNWQLFHREYVNFEEEWVDGSGEIPGHTQDAFSLDDPYHPTTEANAMFKTMIGDLSEGSQEIVKILFDCPEEFRSQLKASSPMIKVTMNRLRKYLRSQGWKFNAIESCFREIKTGLTTLNF